MTIIHEYWFINDLNFNASNLSIFNKFENNASKKMSVTIKNKKKIIKMNNSLK